MSTHIATAPLRAPSTPAGDRLPAVAEPGHPGAPVPSTAGTELVVSTQGLTKTFGKGQAARTVVDRLDLAVPRGCVYGFLGPNGSGKSTTMKMLLGLLTPTAGTATLFGTRLERRNLGQVMARTGSMIEQPPGYGHLTGAENMRVVQRMLGLSEAQVARALALVRLTEHKDRLVRAYSLGMKQRLGIAMALAREPELLVLDEPTNGLDPAGIEEVRSLLVHLAGEGVTVMVSSHLLDEIDKMASVLGVLSAGRMVFQGTRAELMRRSVPDLLVVTPTPEAVDARLLAGLGPRAAAPAATTAQASATTAGTTASASAGVAAAPAGAAAGPVGVVRTPQGVRVSGLGPQEAAELNRRLVAAGVEVHELRREAQSLEDVFMDLTGGAGVL